MDYPYRVLVAVDQLLATVFLGTMPDETISAAVHRRKWKRAERFINWLFNDPRHCAEAYQSELDGTQNAPTYQKEK